MACLEDGEGSELMEPDEMLEMEYEERVAPTLDDGGDMYDLYDDGDEEEEDE